MESQNGIPRPVVMDTAFTALWIELDTHERILFTLSLHGVHEAFYHRARRRHGLLSYALNLISRLRMIRRRSAAQQRTNANERTPS